MTSTGLCRSRGCSCSRELLRLSPDPVDGRDEGVSGCSLVSSTPFQGEEDREKERRQASGAASSTQEP